MWRRWWGLSFVAISCLVALSIVLGSSLPEPLGEGRIAALTADWLKPAPAIAQRALRVGDVQAQVYLRLPNLPKENQYVSAITGESLTKSTLVDRMVRYHIYTKGRPANFRFDWKLTIADYLNANEYIWPQTYPGGDNFTENPVASDRAAIASLNRSERNALVQALVDIFNAKFGTSSETRTENPASAAPSSNRQTDSPTSGSGSFSNSPQPGDAQRLIP